MPAERVPALVSAVRSEGNFDVTEPQALGWLNAAHRLLVVRSTYLRKRLEVGPSVAGQANYVLPPEVVQIREVLVGGIPFGTGKHSDIAADGQGWLTLCGPTGSGVTAPDSDAAGVDQLSLVPAPSSAGLTIQVYAVCRPPALNVADDSTLKVPAEFDEAIINGALATGLAREAMRPDLAAQFRPLFDASCTELLKQARRRYRGPGPTQIRISGYNAT